LAGDFAIAPLSTEHRFTKRLAEVGLDLHDPFDPPSCASVSGGPGSATAESRSRLLQQRRASVSILLPSRALSSLDPGATFVRRLGKDLPPVDPAPSVGKHAPFSVVAVQAERDRQQDIFGVIARGLVAHTRLTLRSGLQLRRRPDPPPCHGTDEPIALPDAP
jgi:hypothetical protein